MELVACGDHSSPLASGGNTRDRRGRRAPPETVRVTRSSASSAFDCTLDSLLVCCSRARAKAPFFLCDFTLLRSPTSKLIMSDELACVYAALILQDDDIAVTAEKLQTILKAASVDVEPYWPGLFAKALEGLDLKQLISNVGSGAGAAPAAPAAAGGAAPASGGAADSKKEEKKKEEEKEESDDDMGFGLFD